MTAELSGSIQSVANDFVVASVRLGNVVSRPIAEYRARACACAWAWAGRISDD
jgi:hypothetical protein